jgi:hypothetical protein
MEKYIDSFDPEKANSFHYFCLFDVPEPEAVAPKEPVVTAANISVKTIKNNIPAKFVKPSEFTKAAFHLLVKENLAHPGTIHGQPFQDDYYVNYEQTLFWSELDMFVLRNDPMRGVPGYIKGQKITCLTVYPRLLEMLPYLKGKIDICAYFPIDGTVFTNTREGKYLAIHSFTNKKRTYIPMLDRGVRDRFLSLPLESVIIMTFACHVLDETIVQSLSMLLQTANKADIRGYIQKFSNAEKKMEKWKDYTTPTAIFEALKLDLYRGNAIPSPISRTHVCQSIYCGCRVYWKALLEMGFIPQSPNDGCFNHDLEKEENRISFYASSLELLKMTGLQMSVYSYGAQVADNEHAIVNGSSKILIKALEEIGITGLADLLKKMYFVVIDRVKLTVLVSLLVKANNELYPKKKIQLSPMNSVIASLAVPRIYEVLEKKGQLGKTTRSWLSQVVSKMCTNQIMNKLHSLDFIVGTIGWLRSERHVLLFMRYVRGESALDLQRFKDESEVPEELRSHIFKMNTKRTELIFEPGFFKGIAVEIDISAKK